MKGAVMSDETPKWAQGLIENVATIGAETRTNNKWIVDTLNVQTARLAEVERKVTIHNGVSEKVAEHAVRISKIEGALSGCVTDEDAQREEERAHRLTMQRIRWVAIISSIAVGGSGWAAFFVL
jgi:hypothetical protein